MVDAAAIERFRDRQRRLLRDTYNQSWQDGVDNYEPPDDVADTPADAAATVGFGQAAVLLSRRRRAYKPPAEPDATARGSALARAFLGVERMASELAVLSPTNGHLAAAGEAVTNGHITPSEADRYALGLALEDWRTTNGWRLQNGDSAAWAGEQNGYAEAANGDGALLTWNAEPEACIDCDELSNMPPMPLEDWPTEPGQGATRCDSGCRCSFEADYSDRLFELTPGQDATVTRIAQQAGPAMPDLEEVA